MGVSLYKIKKWYQMLTGKSIAHVNQDVGKYYSKTQIRGYYNDLTEKVTRDDPDILVPQYYVETGEKMYFSIGIFQYGLAAYDLYLSTGKSIYKDKFTACADWALEHQNPDGSFTTFAHQCKNNPYSSMAQGEATSLLLRCGIATDDSKYYEAATRAISFMLIPVENGGTTKYEDDNIYFYEFPEKDLVLNGWIFSLFGLYDYCKFSKDEKYNSILNNAVNTLKSKLPDFDNGFWSKYDSGRNICSPFYHKLHIAQLKVLYDLFEDGIFKEYFEKWIKYDKSFLKPKIAFVIKAIQKIFN